MAGEGLVFFLVLFFPAACIWRGRARLHLEPMGGALSCRAMRPHAACGDPSAGTGSSPAPGPTHPLLQAVAPRSR